MLLTAVPANSVDKTFTEHIRALPSRPLAILEAGCGRQWPLSLDGVEFMLTGVDINAESLRLRQEKVGDLNEVIVGDLRSVNLPANHFDVVYCSFLLEHVRGARLALDNMVGALRPGGLLLLKVPDRDSVFGWVARRTPHRTHVWYKRRIRGSKHAGEPGYGPFPVVYDCILSWSSLQEYFGQQESVVLQAMCTNDHLAFFPGWARIGVDSILHGIAHLSRGRLSADHANMALVVRKSGAGGA